MGKLTTAQRDTLDLARTIFVGLQNAHRVGDLWEPDASRCAVTWPHADFADALRRASGAFVLLHNEQPNGGDISDAGRLALAQGEGE